MTPFRRRARRGAAMSEMVLVLPFLLIILSLVFFFGRLMVRAQHIQAMSRYETWRDVIEAPGPAPRLPGPNYHQLNLTFLNQMAADLDHSQDSDEFPEQMYVDLIDAAAGASDDAGRLAESLLYAPPGSRTRMSHGHREGFRAAYTTDIPFWRHFEGPIRRDHARIGHEWHFSHDWTAGPDRWTGQAQPPHHLRALRDVFLNDFDEFLDALDGDSEPEYPTDDTQRSNTEQLASFIRSLYLHEPAYRGPIVFDEAP
jgi:hypothetical protein